MRRDTATPDLFEHWENMVAVQWHPTCRYVVNRWFKDYVAVIGEDELMSEANFALAVATRKYHPHMISRKTGQRISLKTYTVGGIYRHLKYFIADWKLKIERMPIHEMPTTLADDGSGELLTIDIEDTAAAEAMAEMEAAEEARIELQKLLRSLKRKGVIRFPGLIRKYLGGFATGRETAGLTDRRTHKQLARIYGVSTVAIKRDLDALLAALDLEKFPLECFAKKRAKKRKMPKKAVEEVQVIAMRVSVTVPEEPKRRGRQTELWAEEMVRAG